MPLITLQQPPHPDADERPTTCAAFKGGAHTHRHTDAHTRTHTRKTSCSFRFCFSSASASASALALAYALARSGNGTAGLLTALDSAHTAHTYLPYVRVYVLELFVIFCQATKLCNVVSRCQMRNGL